MPTTRIQDKLSKIVRSQFPEFIRDEYSTFIKFVEYYYQFLEQDQQSQELIQNARSYADIDRTAASFVEYFLKQYGKNIPTSLLVNKPLLIKQLNDLYEAKGSELSFKLLFRILFDADVTVKYPFENVLRASDGTWEQLISLRVETVTGDRNKISNHYLKFEKNNVVYTIRVIKTVRLTDTLTEVFIDPSSPAVIQNLFENNDDVYVLEGTTNVFTGKVKLTTTGYTITTGGTGFKVGQIFKVNIGGAVNTLFKVTSVSAVGAITGIKFINYGYNFTAPVAVNFVATSSVGSVSDEYNTRTNGFTESGIVYTDGDYFDDPTYTTITYVMTASASFSSSQVESGGTTVGLIDDTYASITFALGTLGRYPGSFTTNRGFISDNEIRLEDNLLYQPFAYQTNTDIDIAKFYDIVKSLIHPTGQQLYNNRVLSNDINVYANVSVISTANIFEELASVLNMDDYNSLNIGKNPTDTINTSDSDVYELTKVISDTIATIDATALSLSTPVANETVTVSDTSVIEPRLEISSLDRFFSEDYTDTLYYAGEPVNYEPVYTNDEISVVVS